MKIRAIILAALLLVVVAPKAAADECEGLVPIVLCRAEEATETDLPPIPPENPTGPLWPVFLVAGIVLGVANEGLVAADRVLNEACGPGYEGCTQIVYDLLP